MFASCEPKKITEAMNYIILKKKDPDIFTLPQIMPGKGSPRERILYLYLVSRSGGIKRFETIAPFTDDPYPYVACQAIRFLSQLNDERSFEIFDGILRNHSNLYVQFTAMEAVRSWKSIKKR
jgi:hypothetical protein